MEDKMFRELYQRIIEQYELSPEIAEKLLQRILAILTKPDDLIDCSSEEV